MIERIKNMISIGKLLVQRASGYVSLVNTGMILFLVLEQFDVTLNVSKVTYILIYVGSFILLLLVGYLDDKLGFFRNEATFVAQRNPYFKQINKKLDTIIESIGEKNRK